MFFWVFPPDNYILSYTYVNAYIFTEYAINQADSAFYAHMQLHL